MRGWSFVSREFCGGDLRKKEEVKTGERACKSEFVITMQIWHKLECSSAVEDKAYVFFPCFSSRGPRP